MDGVTETGQAHVFTGHVLVSVDKGRAYYSGYRKAERAREVAEELSRAGEGEIVVQTVVFE